MLTNSVRSISVVTVCLNTRGTIRLTMESIKNQSFPHVRHVIVDGGSTDGTLDIIREYNPHHLISEKDDGIYHAMDKGASTADGDLLIFLNAGDTFFDDTVCEKVAAFAEKSRADIVFGDLLPVRISRSDSSNHGAFEEGKTLSLGYMRNRKFLYNESIHHQATFYRRWVFDKCTYLSEDKHASGEYNLLLNAVQNHGASVKYIPRTISRFALGGTSTNDFESEWQKYSKARDTLRERYMPDFAAIKIKSETEFHTRETAAPLQFLYHGAKSKILQRTKAGVKKSPFFGLYSRIANGIAGRASNKLSPEIRTVVAGEVRAALNEYLSKLAESEKQQVKRLETIKRRQDKQLRALSYEIVEALKKSTEKTDRKIRSQRDELKNMESAIREASDRSSSEAMQREVSYQNSLNSAIGEMRQGLTASIESTGSGRQGVLLQHSVRRIDSVLEKSMLNVARIAEASSLFDRALGSGFSAFSQWDEDGILQYLVRKLELEDKFFVEFGVGDYLESNTRLLLMKDNWAGLVLDNDSDRLTLLKNSALFWRYPLTVQETTVEPGNINETLIAQNVSGQIGLLSIDIDGMDYWVWDAIKTITPTIVVCEYNSLWGAEHALTVPYENGFDRTTRHYSWSYAGASLPALKKLAKQKGYTLVAVNEGGNNAFFVSNEALSKSELLSDPKTFRAAKFREARDQTGALSFASPASVLESIKDLELYDLEAEKLIRIEELELY